MRTLLFLGIAFGSALTHASANVITLPAQQDNTLFSESNTLSNGMGDYFFAGITAQGATRRALIQFDVSAVPAGSTINSVQLVLTMSMAIVGPENVDLHRALASWAKARRTRRATKARATWRL